MSFSYVELTTQRLLPRSKVGFVGDIRRMNVAITRAQRACWILGDAATLRSSPTWQALMEDAEDRTRVIQNATARSLFPEQFGAGGGTGPHTMARHPSPRESLAPAAGPAGFSAGRGAPFPPPEDPRQHSMSAWGGGAPEASGWRQYPSAWGGPSGQQQLDGMALWGGGRGGGSSPFDSSPNSVLGGWRKGSF